MHASVVIVCENHWSVGYTLNPGTGMGLVTSAGMYWYAAITRIISDKSWDKKDFSSCGDVHVHVWVGGCFLDRVNHPLLSRVLIKEASKEFCFRS